MEQILLRLECGTGDDTFVTMSANLTSADIITGGIETADTLEITDATAVTDIHFTNVTGVEVLKGSGSSLSATLDTEAINGGAGFKRVFGTTSNDIITIAAGFAGAIAIDLTGGNADTDTVSAALSTAVVTLSASAADITAADTLTGGTGAADAMLLKADNLAADLSGVTGFETITVVVGAAAGDDITIMIGSANVVADAKTLTVSAAALIDSGAQLVFDGSAETGGLGAFNVTGGAGADTITGGTGVDTIDGGADNDTLVGLGGIDTITGGTGNDVINGGAGNDLINAGDGSDTSAVAAWWVPGTTPG